MKHLFIVVVIALTFAGCKTTEPEPVKMWWGAKGDTVAWEKAKEVMENYNWIVLSSELEQ